MIQLTFAAVESPLFRSVTLSTFLTSPPYSLGTLWKPFATLSEKSIGDLKPAPTIRASPLPVSSAESICIFFRLSANFDDEPVSERDAPTLEAEFFRPGRQPSGDKSPLPLGDDDREPCAEAENASAMKADLCEGDPGAPGLVTAALAFSGAGDCIIGGVLSPLSIDSAPVAVREAVGRPARLDSPVVEVSSDP